MSDRMRKKLIHIYYITKLTGFSHQGKVIKICSDFFVIQVTMRDGEQKKCNIDI